MVDKSGTPFWGKQKPLKHYYTNGLISFAVRKGQLWFHTIRIDKTGIYDLNKGIVKDKHHLDELLKCKNYEQLSHLV